MKVGGPCAYGHPPQSRAPSQLVAGRGVEGVSVEAASVPQEGTGEGREAYGLDPPLFESGSLDQKGRM